MKGFALRLALKQRHKRTRKWPIRAGLWDGKQTVPRLIRDQNGRQCVNFDNAELIIYNLKHH